MAVLTGCEKKVKEALQHADGKALSRAGLVLITGYDDRTIRMAIASLIDNHNVRIETHSRGGYFIPADNDPYSIGARVIKQGFSLVKRGKKMLRLSERAERLKLQEPLPFIRRRNVN